MHSKHRLFLAALALALTAGLTPARADDTEAQNDTTPNDTEQTQAVEQANAEFYTSLNALFTGDIAPMLNVWSHADDVSYAGPAGGFQIGWDQVRSRWEEQAALKLGGKIEPKDTRITIGGDLAFVQSFEQGDNVDPQGNPVQVSIRATSLFRKENGQWKLVAHHTDPLSFLEQETRTQSTE